MPTGFTLCIIKYYIYVLYIASYYHVTILHYHYHNKYHFICNYLKVLCIKQKLSLFGNKLSFDSSRFPHYKEFESFL